MAAMQAEPPVPTKRWLGTLGLAFGAGLVLAGVLDGDGSVSTWDQIASVVCGIPLACVSMVVTIRR